MSYREIWNKHAILREGKVLKVYLDSLGKPTAGIGHLLTETEKKTLKVDDPITDQQCADWFAVDSARAIAAAKRQAREIGIETDWFIAALISVNFQLGDGWVRKFKMSYPAIVRGDYDAAIKGLRSSLWYSQTPVRVEDFIQALEKAKAFKERPVSKTRTMAGAGMAGTSVIAGEVVAEVAAQVEPLAMYSESLKLLFLVLALVGVGLTIYARLDDRKQGKR